MRRGSCRDSADLHSALLICVQGDRGGQRLLFVDLYYTNNVQVTRIHSCQQNHASDRLDRPVEVASATKWSICEVLVYDEARMNMCVCVTDNKSVCAVAEAGSINIFRGYSFGSKAQ